MFDVNKYWSMECKYWFILRSGLWTYQHQIEHRWLRFKSRYYYVMFFAAFAFLLLLKYGDVEVNAGPKKKEARSFSCFHCNVNSISAHNNFSLLEAYNTLHQYIFCIPETYSDSSFQLMTLLFLFQVIILFDLIILAIVKGVVFACFTRRIYIWDQLMYHSFLRVCYVKWPFKVKKVRSLLSIDLQISQQLNLMNSY